MLFVSPLYKKDLCTASLVSPFNNAECKGWIVSIIRCRTAEQMEDRGGVAFDHSQGQTIPIIPRVSQHILEVIFVGGKSAMFWEHQK